MKRLFDFFRKEWFLFVMVGAIVVIWVLFEML